MVKRNDTVRDENGKTIDGFVVECDCCGRLISEGDFKNKPPAVYKDRNTAIRGATDNDCEVMCRGEIVICYDCLFQISRYNIEVKFIDRRKRVKFSLLGCGEKAVKFDLDLNEVSFARMVVKEGDETLHVFFKDGKEKTYDSCEEGWFRELEVDDYSYIAYDPRQGINLFADEAWMKGWSREVRRARATQLENAIIYKKQTKGR